jgi:hypothetical protein
MLLQIYNDLHFYTIIFAWKGKIFLRWAEEWQWPEGQGVWKEAMQVWQLFAEGDWILGGRSGYLSCWSRIRVFMAMPCKVTGCKNDSPPALAEQQQVCVLHFTLSIEGSCAEMRRETALGNAPHERQREIMKFITESGERLARVATSGLHLTDDLKARILSTFLTLMNLRENLDRSNMRSSFGRTGQHR